MLTLKPSGELYLILPHKPVEKTASGIIIPETGRLKQSAGEIIAKGEGTPMYPMEYNVGQQVIFNKTAFTPYEEDGIEYYLVKQREILGSYGG